MKGHLYLVGFMGSGKSTVGPILADQLGREFLDLDELIEEAEETGIPRIFDLRGEAYFRQLESRILASVRDREPSVVALGGGAFSQAPNRGLIFRTGIAVTLRIPLELAWQRSTEMDNRPLARDRQQFEDPVPQAAAGLRSGRSEGRGFGEDAGADLPIDPGPSRNGSSDPGFFPRLGVDRAPKMDRVLRYPPSAPLSTRAGVGLDDRKGTVHPCLFC